MPRSALFLLVALVGCGRSFTKPQDKSQTAPLQAAAVQTAVAPHESTQVQASGGTPPYTFALTQRGSGPKASVDGDGGYLAGDEGPGVDIIQVQDSAGQRATTAISIGPPITLFPTLSTTVPGGTLTFVATGGKPPYSFAMKLHANTSWGSIQPSGVYTAGPNPDEVDVVVATDQLGQTSSATVNVSGGSLGATEPGVTLVRGDWNGDGLADALVIDSSNTGTVILGRTSGPVVAQHLTLPPFAVTLVGDFDGDGCDDIWVQAQDGKTYVLHGAPDGNFIAGPVFTFALPAGLGTLQAPAFAPVDLRPARRKVLLAGLWGVEFPFCDLGAFEENDDRALASGPLGLTPFHQVYADQVGCPTFFNAPEASSLGAAVLVSDFIFGPALYVQDLADDGDGGVVAGAITTESSGNIPLLDRFLTLPFDFNGDGRMDLYGVENPNAQTTLLRARVGFADGGFDVGSLLLSGVRVAAPAPADGVHPAPRLLALCPDGGYEIDSDDGGISLRPAALPLDEVALLPADFNGDGVTDLLTSTALGELRFFSADALGQYQTGRRFKVHPGTVSSSSVRLSVGDIDGDGHADALADDYGVAVLAGTPQGTFSREGLVAPGTRLLVSNIGPVGPLIATQADDGRVLVGRALPTDAGWTFVGSAALLGAVPDRATPIRGGGPVPGGDFLAHLVFGPPNFVLERTLLDGGFETLAVSFPDGYLVPVGGDGDVDDLVFQASVDTNPIELHPSVSSDPPSWSATAALTLDSSTFHTDGGSLSLVASFPFARGDRPNGLIVTDPNASRLFIYDLRSHAAQTLLDGFQQPPIGSTPVAIGDLNGDGLTDLVLLDRVDQPGTKRLLLALGNGQGGFNLTAAPLQFNPSTYISLGVGDVNGDGFDDVVIYDSSQSSLTVYLASPSPDGGVSLR